MGKFEEAYKLIEENGEEDYQTKIELIIFKSRILRSLGEFEKAKLLISELIIKKNSLLNLKKFKIMQMHSHENHNP